MPQNTEQLRVAALGDVYVADVGTTAPEEPDAAWPTGWVSLGLVSEDGVTFTDSREAVDIMAWQMAHPARRAVETRSTTLAFGLGQWSADAAKLAFGGTVETTTAGNHKYVAPAPEDIGEKALGIEWVDGTVRNRIIVPRGSVIDDVETVFVRNNVAWIQLTFAAIGSTEHEPWYMLTNDPAFAA